MSQCTEVQERIALGAGLLDEDGRHIAGCSACAAVAEDWSRLQALLEDAPVTVPPGFADRVMARLDDADVAPGERLVDRRWVQIALANLGALVTVANIVRFVASLLVPSSSLGATP